MHIPSTITSRLSFKHPFSCGVNFEPEHRLNLSNRRMQERKAEFYGFIAGGPCAVSITHLLCYRTASGAI